MSNLRITPTPWRDRLIAWSGAPFRSQLFPFLFHRFDVRDEYGWRAGFWRKSDALRWITTAKRATAFPNRHILEGSTLVGWRSLRTGLFSPISELGYTSDREWVPVFMKNQRPWGFFEETL